MINKAVVEQILNQAREVEYARAKFIKDSDFYSIRDLLFTAVTALEVNDDSAVALDLDVAAQLVEYIERTEELIPAMAMLIYALVFGTAVPGWIAHQQPFGAHT